MATRRVEDLEPRLRSLLVLGTPSALGDGQLLDRFATGEGPGSALAFEALVDRHGPMVRRVCRGVLGDRHDAQDAFQATFLVLVRKAKSIRDRDSVASWLHGVALRVASHAKATEARRRRLEREAREEAAFDPGTGADDDLGSRLHEEVARLPERYRAAVVLCYLEGHTCEDAARVLRWPVGTVKSRLSRAKERLRRRLTRPGLAPESALERPFGSRAVLPMSPRLTRATAELAARFGVRSSAPSSTHAAVSLAKGALNAMVYAKLKWPAMALLAGATCLAIASARSPAAPAQEPRREKTVDKSNAKGATPAPIPAPDPLALTVPRDVSATAGRGTILMYALDPKTGERVVDDRAQKTIEAKVAGRAGAKDLIAPAQVGPWKEADVDVRWVAITGIVDNQAIRDAEARARKGELDPTYPQYRRIDVQRQARMPGKEWSDWAGIDIEKNYEILDNLPEVAPERTPEELRPTVLVDSLPILKKGQWIGVDSEVMLKFPPKPVDVDFERAAKERLQRQPILQVEYKPGKGPFKVGKVEYRSPILAVRYLDFTVEAGTSYRHRVRIVLVNPKADEEPNKRDLYGPWSEPTAEVTVP